MANGKNLKRVRIDDLLSFYPKTDNQSKTYNAYKEGKNLVLHGLAGTGKTFVSLYLALEEVLDKSELGKIVELCFAVTIPKLI